jgi:hypothetical protein
MFHWLVRLGLVESLLRIASTGLLLHIWLVLLVSLLLLLFMLRLLMMSLLMSLLLNLLMNLWMLMCMLFFFMRDGMSQVWLLITRVDFSELLNKLGVLFLKVFTELPGQVENVVGVHKSSSVHFTVSIDVRTMEELLVKAHNNLLLSLTHDCAS